MTSRNAYAALTPDHANFGLGEPLTPVLSSSSSRRPSSPFIEAIEEGEEEEEDINEDTAPPSRFRAAWRKTTGVIKENTGLLLIVASQVFLSLMNVAVKKLNSIDPPVSALELVVVRMVITYICCISYMLLAGVNDPWLGPKGVRLLLVFRGFSGFFGLFGVYFSLQYLSLSDATVLTFLAPLCTAISGAIFLKESITRREVLAGLVSLLGVVLIARPVFIFGHSAQSINVSPIGEAVDIPPVLDGSEKSTPEQRLIAVGVALIGVLGATGAYTSLRAIGKRAHPLHSMMSFSTQCVIISSIGMIATKTPFTIPTRLEWLALLFMIGIFGFSAQVLLTMGLQRETAGRGSMAIYTQVVFATILERIFFHTSPPALSVIGTFMIIASALYVALTKQTQKETERKSNNVRLESINEASLEEGLLERTRDDEDAKDEPEESVIGKERLRNEVRRDLDDEPRVEGK